MTTETTTSTNRITQLLHTAFPDLSANNVEMLAQVVRVHDLPANHNICREGDTGASLFILDEGLVDIWVNTDLQQELFVEQLTPGRYFGEMALLGHTTRMATIRTQQPSRVLEIDEADFIAVAQTNPSLLRSLLRQIIGHLRRTDRAVINELHEKNKQLSAAFSDLERQEELRSQVIVTLSHELRTPLTSINGYLGLINQGAFSGNSLQTALASITRNVEKLIGHTNDLLLLYEMHPKAAEFEYANVADMMIEALNAAREAMQAQTTGVSVDIAPDLPELFADRHALVLALRTLIENAFKYSPNREPIALLAYREQNEVALAVRDKGIGIPQEAQMSIFDAFYRLEKEGATHLFPGLGVGLTIAKFMVQRNNGRITVESAPGTGSTFTIHIPVQANGKR
jgi:signal transduction histidine kinase